MKKFNKASMTSMIKFGIATVLLLACYQSRTQQAAEARNLKRRRMYLYPGPETPAALTVKPLTLRRDPARELIEICLPKKMIPPKNEHLALEIYDKQGFLMVARTWRGQKINLSAFPTGVYMVSIKTEHYIFSQRLIINR